MNQTLNYSPRAQEAAFRADVLAGLAKPQKAIPAKYFYDDFGSKLFDQICELPEYYPTVTELGILQRHAAEMAAACGSNTLLIELGAGSLKKVRYLLDELVRPAGFVAVDVSGRHLRVASLALQRDYPGLLIHTVVADFTQPFAVPQVASHRKVLFFPGSTLGNFTVNEANALLRHMARVAGPGGGLLLGVDLVKPIPRLEAAYNDRAGVTAAFNKNLLTRINRELDANFDLDRFEHRAHFNPASERIEMHLYSLEVQTVYVAGQAFQFAKHESIHTENSHKYDLARLAQRAANCGWICRKTWTDKQKDFAVLYFEVV